METTETDAHDRADMERLIAGHDAALNDLMERHATRVFHFLCRMVGNEDDANDLAQETFVRVFKSRASFRIGQKFSSWLLTIAANLARNHFRWRPASDPVARCRKPRDGTVTWQHAPREFTGTKRGNSRHRTCRSGPHGHKKPTR